MEALLTALAVLYLATGLAVYVFTDSRGVASRIASRSIVLPFGPIAEYLFLFVVALWPLWLALLAWDARESGGE